MSYAGQITLENSDLQIPFLKNFLDKIGDMISGHHHKDANLHSTQSEMINTDEEEEVMEPGSIINHDNSVQDMSGSEVKTETAQEEEIINLTVDKEEEVMEPGSVINHDNSVQDMSVSEVKTETAQEEEIIDLTVDKEEEVMEPGSVINHDNSVQDMSVSEVETETAQEEKIIDLTIDNEREDVVVIPSDEEEEILEPTPDSSVTFPAIIDDYNKDLWEPSGFFQDDKLDNALSPVRVGSFTALLAAIMLGGLTVLGNTQAAEAEATYALLGAAFGSKIVQKVSK
jgi:hypothetical protein